MSLDKIDLKILYDLDYNARISLTELSARVGISKQNLNYRLKKLHRQRHYHFQDYYLLAKQKQLYYQRG